VLSATLFQPEAWAIDGWRTQSACTSLDPELFFPIGSTGDAVEQIVQAKAICSACPVRNDCLTFAITSNQEYGVWGGTTEDERRVLRRSWRAEQRAQQRAPRSA